MMPRKRARPAGFGLLFFAMLAVPGPPAQAQESAPDAPVPASAAPEGDAPAPSPKKRPPLRRAAAKPAAAKPAEAPADATTPAAAPGGEQHAEPPPARKPAPPPPRLPAVKAPVAKPAVAKPAAAGPAAAAGSAGQPEAASPIPSVPVAAPSRAPESASPTPAALAPPPVVAAEPPSACESRAALFDGQKGFSAFVTRLGRVEVENPLRPLTPDVTRVLLLTISGKVATAYGPDLTDLRRGGSPAALEGQLGGGIRWEPSLPLLPETLTIVSEAGEPLARLAFRACTDAPAVKAPPPQANAKERRPGSRRPSGDGAAPKTPPGFRLPQGAIAQ